MSGDAARLEVLERAQALADGERWADAIALCDQALASDAESAAAWNLKGFCLRALGRKAEALSAFKRARLHLPVYAPIRYNLATALRESGDLKGALAEFDEALKLDPADLQARLSRAVVKLDLGDEAGARADFDECRRRDPALFDLGFSVDGRRYVLGLDRIAHGWAMGCGRVEGGGGIICEVAEDAWLNDPKVFVSSLENKYGWDHDGLYSFAYPHEDPEEGRTTVELYAAKKIEQVPEAFFERFMTEFGLACLDAAAKFGDPEGWEELRPRLLALRARAEDPDAAMVAAAETFAAERRWTEALFTARQVLERNPGSAPAWSVSGRALAGLDEVEEAERSLNEALRLAPTDVAALSARAALRLRRKDEAGALRDLDAMLEALPAGPERDALLKRAEGLRGAA